MAENNKVKLTLKEHGALIWRALMTIHSLEKPILLTEFLYSLTSALAPFVNLYFSAQIINELLGLRRIDRIVQLVLMTIILNFVAYGIKNICNRWKIHSDSQSYYSFYKIFSDKLVDMDYNDFEDPNVQQRVSTIRQHQNGMGFGMPRITWYYEKFLNELIKIIIAIGFGVSLVGAKVPVTSSLAFLDSYIGHLGFALLLGTAIVLPPIIMWKGGKVWASGSDINNKGNRLFSFYYFEMIKDTEKGKDVRLYKQQDMISEHSKNEEVKKNWERMWGKYGSYSALSTLVTHLCGGLLYMYVAVKAYAGAIDVGEIVLYVGVLTQLTTGVAGLLTAITDFLNNNPFLKEIFDYLDIPNKKYQGTLTVEKRDDNDYQIEFKNVYFKYPGTDNYVLEDINLKFDIGKKVALVGMNGSGKSTLIKLLCRLYDPDQGVITLNGIDIKKYDYEEYTNIFAMVFQDFKLLPFTLGQNVATDVDVDEKKAEEALRKAGFGERLDSMEHKLDTYLYKDFEEEGVDISGGEAQKIALARALYKEAPFVVLDEPTAALDPVAEYEIYSKFNEIVEDRTALYISHRLASCRFCDDIIVLHKGKVIQRGHHEELIEEKNGKYIELWDAQAQYYKEKAV